MTTIDNFNLIKGLIDFEESDNLFMHLQILRRGGKDHPDLPAANKLIKSWLVRSREHLDSLKRRSGVPVRALQSESVYKLRSQEHCEAEHTYPAQAR